jgi:hypothetical protein
VRQVGTVERVPTSRKTDRISLLLRDDLSTIVREMAFRESRPLSRQLEILIERGLECQPNHNPQVAA